MANPQANTVPATPRCLARLSGLTSCAQSASYRPATNRFSCFMTSLDTSTARLRGFWGARQVAQSRNFTRQENGFECCCKENKFKGKPQPLALNAELQPAPSAPVLLLLGGARYSEIQNCSLFYTLVSIWSSVCGR